MILLPAIDIRGGKAVRLRQGDFDQETVYNEDPLDAARAWTEQGARFLHVIDLDGAREGKPQNLDHLERITSELPNPGTGDFDVDSPTVFKTKLDNAVKRDKLSYARKA